MRSHTHTHTQRYARVRSMGPTTQLHLWCAVCLLLPVLCASFAPYKTKGQAGGDKWLSHDVLWGCKVEEMIYSHHGGQRGQMLRHSSPPLTPTSYTPLHTHTLARILRTQHILSWSLFSEKLSSAFYTSMLQTTHDTVDGKRIESKGMW